ncbi:ABC transporter substrate-binding protein [Nakamurella leprariae]|uniref:Solute-binding protein family 5 domain-containing protein n=1 Tax=Nakamurella leprariae TaxID=2803911 RepID=A0A939C1W4_9ACTN|nr:ABC transporter substrate-binding protein [Nakamurella leprariae]MBM9467589.1 hypothetical protein [Nakamurella leprariae]
MARTRIRPRSRWLAALGAASVLLASCGGSSDAGSGPTDGSASGPLPGQATEIDPNGTFRYVFVQTPSSFDPHRSANQWDNIAYELVYDHLIYEDQNGELQPQVATSWEFVDDGTALVMQLRDDVTFIDGTTLDAEAVKANLDRARTLENGTLKGTMSRIASVDVISPTEIRINLAGPGGDLPGLFASTAGALVSPAAFDNPDLDQNPVGSGMARMTEYIPNQVVKFERNPDYWDPEAAKAAKYELYGQPTAATRMNMLLGGQADAAYLEPSQADQARGAGLNAVPSKSLTVLGMTMNPSKPPFDDFRVREAVEHAIDREGIVDGVFFGFGTPVAQFIPPTHWAHDPAVEPDMPEYNLDPAKSRELLAEAGYPDGVEFEMLVPGTDSHRGAAEALVPMFAEAGFTVNTRVIDSATTGVTFFSRQEGNAFIGMGSPWADPTTVYQGNLPGQYANPWNLTTPEFETAWKDALVGTTQQERLPAIADMVQAEKQIRKSIPIHHHTPPTVWTTNVVFPEGYEPEYMFDMRRVAVGTNA